MTQVATIEEAVQPTKGKLGLAFILVIFSYILAGAAAFGIGYALTGLMHTNSSRTKANCRNN